MTHDEMNIAIAEVCGWKQVTQYNLPEDIWENLNEKPSAKAKSNLPNYCNDLNAMHEAEKTLRRDQQNFYINYLSDMVDDECPVKHDFDWCCATAHQRAEAFLRTLNLYTQ